MPLDTVGLRKIAVIGPNARTAQIMGSGSAQVNADYRVSPLEGLQARISAVLDIGYERGCSNYKMLPMPAGWRLTTADGQAGFAIDYFNNLELSGESIWRGQAPSAELELYPL